MLRAPLMEIEGLGVSAKGASEKERLREGTFHLTAFFPPGDERGVAFRVRNPLFPIISSHLLKKERQKKVAPSCF